jgi:hypothetical protein
MPFHIKYDADFDCVVTKITGNIDKNLISKFFTEVGKVAADHNCSRILSDLREAKVNAPVSHMYEMAKTIEKLNIKKSFRRAVVISTDHKDYEFWETVCYNQGYQFVKIFQDYEQARDWVTENR